MNVMIYVGSNQAYGFVKLLMVTVTRHSAKWQFDGDTDQVSGE